MINDHTNGKLAEIKVYATEHNLEDSFNKTFARFETFAKSSCEVNLYSDFAPLSLYFEITKEDKLVLNGGFIFHGPHDGYGNGGAPTFSVSIESEKQPGWSIHT